jgi:hypothetical protein
MRKLKGVISVIVSAVMTVGMLPTVSADVQTEKSDVQFSAEASMIGITDGKTLKVSAKITSETEKSGYVTAYKATYDKDDKLKKATTEKIFLEAYETEKRTLTAEYDEKNGEYAKIYLWEKDTNKPICDSISSTDCDEGDLEGEEITINKNNVFASKESESSHIATAVGDGDISTYWSAKNVTENDPQYVAAVFDNVYNLTRVGIAFGKGSERSYDFSVEASTDGTYYETVLDRRFSEKTDDVQYYETSIAKAKYVRFVIYGKDTSDSENWVQVSEIEAYGIEASLEEGEEYNLLSGSDWSVRAMTEYSQTYTPTLGSELFAEKDVLYGEDALHVYDNVTRDGRITNMVSVESVTASQTPESGNPAKNVIDMSTSTKWTAENVSEDNNAYVILKFKEETYVDLLKISFGEGSRGYKFDVSLSTDGVNYETVVEKTTAEKNDNLQEYSFDRTKAEYMKVTFFGREDVDEGWIQVTEIEPCDTYYEIEGAGGVLVGKQYQTPSGRGNYNISFDMYLPSVNDKGTENNFYWSGITLANAFVSGGADSSNYAAMQLRFENSNGRVKIDKITSNRFNEGDLASFFTTTFNMDCDIHFSFDVDPTGRKVDIKISDGEHTANRMIYFNYDNDERTRSSTWTGLEANWLIFNSGAGAKSEYYVKNITVTEQPEIESTLSESFLGAPEISEDSVEFKSLSDSQGSYTGSLGKQLYGEVVDAPSESGIVGKAIHLVDNVGRTTDSVNGAGGVAAYIDLPSPDDKNSYKIEFTMYAPVSDEYGGFSLSSGRNYTVGSADSPLAMQVRFKESGDGIKFSAYDSEKLNNGTLSDLVGKYTPIEKSVPWDISIEVNPHSFVVNMSIDDGVNYQYDKTKSYCGDSSVWTSGQKLDTLMINTGIGGNGDIYVGNIKVTDLGGTVLDTASALNGVVRLMATYGTGKYMHHNGNTTVDFKEKQTLNYTRFVERGGLMDSDGVSFEAMNKPGYYLTIMPGDDNVIQLQPYENNARFKANATFMKEKISGSSKNVIYSTYRDKNKFLYDNSGNANAWSMHDYSRICFKVKDETSAVVGDDFKSGFRWDEWIPGYAYNQTWSGGNLLSYHNHSGVARSSNIVVENGICTLKATKDSSAHAGDTWGINYSNYNFYDESGNHKKWTNFAGYVGVLTARRTSGSSNYDPYKFNKNSLIEGSFKQPVGARGYWTAFWLTGETWPPEIDIFEYMSRYGGGTWYSNIHRSTSSSEGSEYSVSDGSLQTKFHTYSLDWGDGFIDYYFDGEFYKRATGDIATFQKNCHLIINTGLGGWEYEPNSQTVWNTGLQLDWVRAYQW